MLRKYSFYIYILYILSDIELYVKAIVCFFLTDLPPETGNDDRILHITPGTLSLDFKPHQAVDIDQQILEVSEDWWRYKYIIRIHMV